MTLNISPDGLARYGPQAVGWLIVSGIVLAGWFSPWFGLLLLVIISIIEIRLLLNWCSDRSTELARQQPTSRSKMRRFRVRSWLMVSAAIVATGYTVFVLMSPYVWIAGSFARAISVPVEVTLDFLLYIGCAAAFISSRLFAERENLHPWRESCNSPARNGVELFVKVFSHPDWEKAGQAWTLSIIIVVGVTLGVGGTSVAAINAKPTDWPVLTGHVPGGSVGNSRSGQQVGSSGGATGGHASTTTTSSSTTTTSPAILYGNRACNTDQVKTLLASALDSSVDTSVEAEYEDHLSDLQCLALGANGSPVATTIGNMDALQFVSSNGNEETGVIAYDAVGDAGEILSSETTFTQAIGSDSDLANVSDPLVVGGAQLQLADLNDGSCVVAVRPDANSVWTIYPESEGAAVLIIFLGMRQIGRPEGQSGQTLVFTYGEPSASLTSGSGGKVVVQGLDPKLVGQAESATKCPLIGTIEKSALHGPPGP